MNLYVVLKVHVESKGAVNRKGLQFFYYIYYIGNYLPLRKNVVIC